MPSMKEFFKKYQYQIDVERIEKEVLTEENKVIEYQSYFDQMAESYFTIANKLGILEAFRACMRKERSLSRLKMRNNPSLGKIPNPNCYISCSFIFDVYDDYFKKNDESDVRKNLTTNSEWSLPYWPNDFYNEYKKINFKKFSINFNSLEARWVTSSRASIDIYDVGRTDTHFCWAHTGITCEFSGNDTNNLSLKICGEDTPLIRNKIMEEIAKIYIKKNY